MEGSKSQPLAKAWIQLVPTLDGSEKAIQKQLAGVGAPAGKTAGKGFGGGFRVGLGPIAALGLGAGAFALGKESIAAASDLGESLNAVDVVFKKNSASIQEMGENAAQTLGLSNVEFNGLAVQFGGFAKAVGGKGKGVVKFLDNITGRAADFASVMNLEVAEAAQLFQSGLAGETEPLRRFGIDLSAAAVEAFALEQGLVKNKKELTESIKVQARYGLLMQETKQAQGDFSNTSTELANSQRILNAEWANAQAELGEGLLPVMTNVTRWMIDEGLPALTQFIDDLDDPSTTVGKLADSLGDVWDMLAPKAETAIKAGAEIASDFTDSAKKAIAASGLDGDFDAYMSGINNRNVGEFAVGLIAANANSLASGQFGEDLVQGWKDVLFPDQTPTGLEMSNLATDIKMAIESAEIDFKRADWEAATAPRTITSDPNARWTDGGTVINVNVDTVVSSDTDDLIRKAQNEARSQKTTGSRPTTKPKGSSSKRAR